jgi:translation initiation factor 4E
MAEAATAAAVVAEGGTAAPEETKHAEHPLQNGRSASSRASLRRTLHSPHALSSFFVLLRSYGSHPLKMWSCTHTHTQTYNTHKTTEWVLWEHKAAGVSKNPNQWKDNMLALCSFTTVEEFWRYMDHLPPPSAVFFDGESRKKVGPEGKTVEEYSLFKKGIEPEWGDPANVHGGEWFCRQFFDGDVLDLYWQNLVMALVGETMDNDDDGDNNALHEVVNGCRVVDKSRVYPMFKLEVWLSSRDPAVRDAVKARLVDLITDGQGGAAHRAKTHPKFEWKDHSS